MIDFPNSPVNGTTYSYQGVTYTYKDTGGGTGFWQVTGPGTYGKATANEIDAGVDAVKYVSPDQLELSDYIKEADLPVSSLSQAGIVQLVDSVSSTSTALAATASSVKTAYDAVDAAQVDVDYAIGQLIGVGQTWQDVSASRSPSVNYTNTTGRPIMVSARSSDFSNGQASMSLFVDGLLVSRATTFVSGGIIIANASVIVPEGSVYRFGIGATENLTVMELR